MRKTVFRFQFMWDYDKEEAWLNAMSAKGWQLVQPGVFFFKFEQGEPNRYRYAIEFLDDAGRKADDYLTFLEETGIEIVGRKLRWVYYRKADDGKPFEIFSDAESKTIHLKRMLTLLVVFLCLEAFFAVRNWIDYITKPDARTLTMAVLFTVLTGLFLFGTYHIRRRMRALK